LRLVDDFIEEILEFLLTLKARYHPREQIIELGSHQLQLFLNSIN
jgi:hypothetical protein